MSLNYFIRRVVFLFLVIWTATTINFLLPHMTGRDPIKEMIQQQIASQGRKAEEAQQIMQLYHRLFGLDKPLWQQYLIYIGNVAQFNFGFSMMQYPRTVLEIIVERAKITLPFVAVATIIAFISGVLLGAILGWNKTPKWIGNIIIPPLMVFSSVPQYLVALVLIYFVAFKARALPLGDPYDKFITVNWGNPKFLASYAQHAILPIMCIVLTQASGWALGMRAMMVTVEGEDYTTFAEAKGLKQSRIFFRYLLRNALLPSLTGLAIQLGAIITGSAVAENYFNYNGLGSTLGAAVSNFDSFLLYGIVLFMVIGIALMTFLMDMIYPLLDPRISYKAQRG